MKSPVYIEATFHVCDENDTSSECQVFSCGLGRHKREVSETKTVKTVVRALNLNSGYFKFFIYKSLPYCLQNL